MAFWTFLANEQSWTLGGSAFFEGLEGHGPGCLAVTINATCSKAGESITVAVDDPVSFWTRIVSEDIGQASVTLRGYNGSAALVFELEHIFDVVSAPYDSGWINVAGVSENADTVVEVSVEVQDLTAEIPAVVYVDSIYVAESEPTAGPVKLYSGYNTLAEVDDTPFTEVQPGALAARSDGKVAVGNGVAEEDQRIAVWNGSAFDDETHDHPVTSPVRRLRWVK